MCSIILFPVQCIIYLIHTIHLSNCKIIFCNLKCKIFLLFFYYFAQFFSFYCVDRGFPPLFPPLNHAFFLPTSHFVLRLLRFIWLIRFLCNHFNPLIIVRSTLFLLFTSHFVLRLLRFIWLIRFLYNHRNHFNPFNHSAQHDVEKKKSFISLMV